VSEVPCQEENPTIWFCIPCTIEDISILRKKFKEEFEKSEQLPQSDENRLRLAHDLLMISDPKMKENDSENFES
jgi:hypothetical protein